MIRLAVIGTNWITDQFIDGALNSGQFSLAGVYSRDIKKAASFSEKYSTHDNIANANISSENAITLFDDLKTLATSNDIDAVYIASPNSFHAPQAIQMMKGGKHVITEKPMASNYLLAQEMFDVAMRYNVVLFEAFMSPYTPNFKILKQEISNIGAIRKATISYCQYSSRYPKYLAGENPNTFNPAFSNGSIMDIGYYCLGSAIELFGEPSSVKAQAHLLESGVDGNGSVILGYDGFDVVLTHSKTSDSYLPSEIQGEEAALHVEMISTGNGVTRVSRSGAKQDLGVEQNENRMSYEAMEFARLVELNSVDEATKQRSLTVAKVLTEIRRQTGVVFPADAIELQ